MSTDVRDEGFSHSDGFTDSMIADRIAFLLQSLFRPRRVGHLGFVVSVDV